MIASLLSENKNLRIALSEEMNKVPDEMADRIENLLIAVSKDFVSQLSELKPMLGQHQASFTD